MARGGQPESFDSAYFRHISRDFYNEVINAGGTHSMLLNMEESRRQSQQEIKQENFPYLIQKRFNSLIETRASIRQFEKENEIKRNEIEEQLQNQLTLNSTHAIRLQELQDREFRVLILGKTGHGKSDTAHTICGKNSLFSASGGSESSTSNLIQDITYIEGQRVRVMDTPGLFDTRMKNEEVLQIISEVIVRWSDGIHAFLYVINYSVRRFTEEEKETFRLIKENFGAEFDRHCVVVFTHGDVLVNDNDNDGHPLTLQNFLQSEVNERSQLGEFLERFDERVVAVDNSSELKPVIARNRKVLLKLFHEASDAGSTKYMNEFFTIAQEIKKNNKRDELSKSAREHIKNTLYKEASFIYKVMGSKVPDDFVTKLREAMDNDRYFDDAEIEACVQNIMQEERETFKIVFDKVATMWEKIKFCYHTQCVIL